MIWEYSKKVPVEETYVQDDKVWYLPHHAVVSAEKPGKVRVVFDCAAKHGEVCLNIQCLQGPDLNNKLTHVLLRFRQYEYAITTDIEAITRSRAKREIEMLCDFSGKRKMVPRWNIG